MATCRGRQKCLAPRNKASNKLNGGVVTANSVALPVTTWELREHNRVAETTNSGTSGRATWLGTVTEADGRCEVIFDSTALLVTDNTLTPGSSVTVKLELGDSGKFFTGSAVIEDIVHKVNNTQDVVKADLTFKYSGTLTQPVT